MLENYSSFKDSALKKFAKGDHSDLAQPQWTPR